MSDRGKGSVVIQLWKLTPFWSNLKRETSGSIMCLHAILPKRVGERIEVFGVLKYSIY